MTDLQVRRANLLAFVDRWLRNIHYGQPGSTMQHGILQKCYTLLDKTLEASVDLAIQLTGAEGEEARRVCCNGKPVSRMTLGERTKVLESLDSELASVLSDHMPQRRKRVLGPSGVRLLHSISKNRNQFTHYEPELDWDQIGLSLQQVRDLCDLDLFSILMAAASGGSSIRRKDL